MIEGEAAVAQIAGCGRLWSVISVEAAILIVRSRFERDLLILELDSR
jgi:hypothetical protein